LTTRGRRLVYSGGIYTLSAGAVLLVIVTGALVTNLIPLYAIGVFLGFTISQAGMTRRFWRAGRLKQGEFTWGLETKIVYDPNWIFKFIVSAVGSFVTFVVMLVFIITKFSSGAWAIVIIIPFLVWVFFQIHRHYKETAARLKLQDVPQFDLKPIIFDPNEHKEVAIYFCDTWSRLAVVVVNGILKRGVPIKIIHIDVDPKRTEAFLKRSEEIRELNGWEEGITSTVEEPYRDLHQNVATLLKSMRDQYPTTYFHIYIGALRTHFPYNLLHMSTDLFLRDALLESENVSLNVKQVNLDDLKLPEGFKVTFEHVADHQHDDDQIPAHS